MFSDFSANGRRVHPSVPIQLISGVEGLGEDFEGLDAQSNEGLEGLGQDDQELKDWITAILTPVADVARAYYDIQPTQTTQVKTASIASGISPIYLLGAGVAAYFLFFRGKQVKGSKKYRRR